MTYAFVFFILGVATLVSFMSIRGYVDTSGLAIAAFLATGALVLLASKIYRKRFGSNIQNPASYLSRVNNFIPNDTRKFVLSIGLLCYALAVVEITGGHSQSSSGRWAWLTNLAIEWLGPDGKGVLFFIIGTTLIISGLVKK